MFTSDCLTVKNGVLNIGGCDTLELTQKYGTPLYVVDENTIRTNCRMFKKSIEDNFENGGLVLFASKALNCLEMCRIVNQEGLGIDCVSGGEIYTALKAKFPAEKIYFHGNNKTTDELIFAIDNNVGVIIVDNKYELEELNELAKERDLKVNIMFRIKPGIDAHTHNFVRTGQIDSKFGFALENGEAYEAVKLTKQMSHLNLVGLHCHIGSQIFNDAPFKEAAYVMLSFFKKLKDELSVDLECLNLGGGFAIKYLESDEDFPYDSAHSLLRVSCNHFAVALKNVLGYTPYIIEAADGRGFHAFCQVYKCGRLYYLDARGLTSSFDEFMVVAREFVRGEYTIREVTQDVIEEWESDSEYNEEAYAFAEAVIGKYIDCYTV